MRPGLAADSPLKVLLDENIDPRLAQDLPDDSEVTSALDPTRGTGDKRWLEWAVKNEYSVFVTGDTNLPHQQNLTSFSLAVVWFEGPQNILEDLRPRMKEVGSCPETVQGGNRSDPHSNPVLLRNQMPRWTFLSSILSTMIEAESGFVGTSIPTGCSVRAVGPAGGRPTVFAGPSPANCQVWHCKECAQTYTFYSGTVFEGRHLPPAKVVLLLRGTCQGKSTAQMAREFDLSRTTVHNIRQQLQANAAFLQPESSVPDDQTETDEAF